MNGVHDMGGMHGMGPVAHEPNEPVFHHEWERRAFALNLAAGFLGKWNLDMSRYARELMPPAEYLATSYYEHWLWGLEKLLVDSGLITREELQARLSDIRPPRAAAAPPAPPAGIRVPRAADLENILRKGRGARADETVPPRFKPGDRVVTRNIHPTGHTRLPRYARGKQGEVAEDHGVWVFPDAHAAGQGRKPQHCYAVRFTARELWGPAAAARESVSIDCFEDYLEPA
jgi:nitrile hydratase subunit beta